MFRRILTLQALQSFKGTVALTCPCSSSSTSSSTSSQVGAFQTELDEYTAKSFDEIPGPSGRYKLPHVGFMFHFKPFTKHDKNKVHTMIMKLFDKYGPIFKQTKGNVVTVYIQNPDDIEKVFLAEEYNTLRNPLEIAQFYVDQKKFWRGLYFGTVEGKDWVDLRAPLQHALNSQETVENFFPKMNDVADDFVAHLSNKRKVPDLREELMGFVTENAVSLGFNTRGGCIGNPKNIYIVATENLYHILRKTHFKPPKYLYYEDEDYTEFKKYARFYYDMGENEIINTLWYIKCQLEKDPQYDPNKDPHLFIRFYGDMNMNQARVKSFIVDLFIGGTEKTVGTMSFLLYHLAKHKDIQDKLHQEIVRETQTEGKFTVNLLENMYYLEACLKESFRIYFPRPIGLERVLTQDMVLQHYHIPKGTTVMCVQNINMTRNPDIFPNPDCFDPERWLKPADTQSNKYDFTDFAVMPFGLGPRNCLGKRYAIFQIYIGITRVLERFELSLTEPEKEIDIIYTPFQETTEPIGLTLTPRK